MGAKKRENGNNEKILIVEDSPTQAAQLAKILTDNGYKVVHASNGQQALDLLKNTKPEVIISDVIMPEMDGYELCTSVKQDSQLREIPFVILTSLSDPADVLRGLECGADHFITKPYKENYLISRLSYLLANQSIRSNDDPQMGLQIMFNGKQQLISSDRLQILNLLLSTYEAAVQQNQELLDAQKQLRAFNQKLEEIVDERTLELRSEIAEKEQAQVSLIRTNRSLQILSECNQAISHSENESILFNQVCQILVETGGYRICWIGLIDKSAQSGLVATSFSCDNPRLIKTLPSQVDMSLEVELLQKSMTTGRIQKVDEITQNSKSKTLEECSKDNELSSLVVVPLLSQSEKIGVLCLYSDNEEGFDYLEEKLLLEVAEDVSYGVNTIRVMTENSRLAEEVAERELLFRTLYDSAPLGFCLSDRNGKIVSYNEAFMKPGNYSNNDIDSMESAENLYYSPEEFQKIKEELEEDRVMVGREVTLKRKDGSPYYALLSLIPIKIKNESLVYAIVEDMTQRKLDREMIVESEKRYRDLFENSVSPIFITNTYWHFVDVNAAGVKMLGYNREKIKELDIRTLFKNSEDLKVIKSELIERERPLNDYVAQILTKEGNILDCILAANQRRSEDGTLLGYKVIMTDVTEKKRIQAQFEQAQKMEAVGRLAGGIAHDFNNQLTVVLGECDLIMSGYPKDDPIQKDVQAIRRAADSASSLTRQMLAFSRKQTLDPKVLDLNEIVINLERMLKRIIGEDIDLSTSYGKNLPRVKVDPGQIEQVIANLTVNARDAMPNGGKLTIETTETELDDSITKNFEEITPGLYVVLSVSDTGEGMTEEVKNRLFEPFFTTKEAGKGTGLGLATVYGIVKQSGGAIHIYSELGKGSIFKIYLPVSSDQSLSKLTKKAEVKTMPTGNERILVVEDEEGVRNLIVRVLSNQGYQLEEAYSGDEALKIFQKDTEFDLVLSDVIMPNMSGEEMAKQVANISPKVKFLFMSGYSEKGIVHGGILKEGIPFLPKPFRPMDLATKVREVLDT